MASLFLDFISLYCYCHAFPSLCVCVCTHVYLWYECARVGRWRPENNLRSQSWSSILNETESLAHST